MDIPLVLSCYVICIMVDHQLLNVDNHYDSLKGHCIEFKYYADSIHSGLTPPGNNS